VTGLVDGKIVAIGGLAYLPDGTVGAFLQIDEEARGFPVLLHKTALKILRESGQKRIVALAEQTTPSAKRWLHRLGFRAVTEVNGETVYLWQS
jgi:hypothetical protein